ncbi:MAG TPA: beta-ketoacyl synthase N-terminal-like domain-containing protein, partial [Candidatus Methylacidiphilales bacterium]|nr:beta-ketoacyl synthase N-terminal-like domain-containing protein [Candidatus Methylacidiphilales bacterium]
MTTPVAIIGFACRLAGAGTSAELWARLNNGLDSNALAGGGTAYTPEEQLAGQFPGQSFAPGFRWPASLLKQVEIDPADFGMAPETARELDSLPLLGMSLVREALTHAAAYGASGANSGSPGGLAGQGAAALAGGLPCAEERAGLVLGFSHSSARTSTLPTYASVAAAVAENGAAGLPSGGDSASSLSPLAPNTNPHATAASDNEAAVQMIAQTMGLRGLHGAVDSGPTAGLAAIQLAVDELESGRCDLMVAGGVQLLGDAERQALVDAAGAAALAAAQAQQAGGAVPAPYGSGNAWGHSASPPEQEGLAMVVLKRLSEAHRDGDRVWGVIRGAGSASQTDGTGRSRIIAAALKAWQAACQEGG